MWVEPTSLASGCLDEPSVRQECQPREALSAFVVSYNRAGLLRTCLTALSFADEIIVVDKSSTDDSLAVAGSLADRVISVPWSPTVEETRGFALDQCIHDWVLCLDDDECLSPEAVLWIDAELRAPRADIYFLPLRHYILGRHDERAYYWPETHPRLFRRGTISFTGTVHAGIIRHSERSFEVPAEGGVCIHHLSHRDVAEWMEKTNRYTSRPDRAIPADQDRDLIAFAHQRIDFWMQRSAGSSGGDYPAAVALLRAVYDMVDRVKLWEEAAGPTGDVLFPRISRRLEAGYANLLPQLRRAHRTRLPERAARDSPSIDSAGEEPAVRLRRTVEALEAALARARCENDAASRAWDLDRTALADQLERARAELAAMRASTLWRLTSPLRDIGSRRPGLACAGRRTLTLAGTLARRTLGGTRWRRIVPGPATRRELASATEIPAEQPVPVETALVQPRPQLLEAAEPDRIAFPDPGIRPVVSVIVPTFGKVDYTLRCLASMAQSLPDASVEIIVIDDASHDPDVGRLAMVRGVRLIANGENLGFLRGCNAAARVARGEFLFFLNNDTQVLPDWLDPMVSLMRDRADAGAVGCKLLFPDGRLQEAGAMVWNNATGLTYGRGDDPDKPAYNYVREVDYVSGAALLLRRALFTELGGFDETFAPAYCEDSDLGFRIRAAGLKVLYQPRSRIVHFEGITNGTDISRGIKRFNEVNQPKLLSKWASVLAAEHFAPGVNVLRACERARGRRVALVLGGSVPAPGDAGFGVLQRLIACGVVVKFWSLERPGASDCVAALQDLGVEVLRGDEALCRLWIAENGAELDAALLLDADAADALILDLRLWSRSRLLYVSRWTGSGTPDFRERSIWRSVEMVLYDSEPSADAAGLLEPAVNSRVLGAPSALREALGLADGTSDTAGRFSPPAAARPEALAA